ANECAAGRSMQLEQITIAPSRRVGYERLIMADWWERLVELVDCGAEWRPCVPCINGEANHFTLCSNSRTSPLHSFLACFLARSSITNSAKSSTISRQLGWRTRLGSQETLFDLSAAMQPLHMPASLKARRYASMPFSFCSFVTMAGFCSSQRLGIRCTLPPKKNLVIFCQRLVCE